MTRDYYDNFQRYSSRASGNFDPRRHLQSYKETDEERRVRKAREQREYEARRAYDRRDYPGQSRRDDDDYQKRKSYDDRGKVHESEGPGKKSKSGDKHSSSTPAPEPPQTFAQIDIASDAPALPKSDIQTIIKRPPYSIARAPTKLESTFPHWFLRGVRFDLDLTPIDKAPMLQNLDAVRLDIEKLHNWQKLVDELQRVNHLNHDAMLTMENDKAEWDKILKARDDEISSIALHNEELEAKVKKLQDEQVSTAELSKQREEMLQSQVKDAHCYPGF